MLDSAAMLDRRRQLLRIVLMVIIVFTLPFYCLGFYLWGTAPQGAVNRETPTERATITPLGGQTSATPSATSTIPLFVTSTQALFPTPGQFIPPATGFIPPTVQIIPPTAAPSLTFAPTSTPQPTNTQVLPTLVPPTNTPQPTATNVPPTATPQPTNTEAPPPTATENFIPPPSDTPSV